MRSTRGSKKFRWCGEKMKSRRIALGLTIQELADQIGTSKSYTWEMEGISQPTVGYAYDIAKILKKPLSFFMIEC